VAFLRPKRLPCGTMSRPGIDPCPGARRRAPGHGCLPLMSGFPRALFAFLAIFPTYISPLVEIKGNQLDTVVRVKDQLKRDASRGLRISPKKERDDLKGAQPGQESADEFDVCAREMKDSMMHAQMTNTLQPAPDNSTSRLDADLGTSSQGIVEPLHRARGGCFSRVGRPLFWESRPRT